ncbi:MAG: thiamine pyrophosphate-binding protein, partial [Rhodospirillaceae bacterium]|nr:thiamine pyrophosphate-binding protein [Rhodospirillaceae bacterium]
LYQEKLYPDRTIATDLPGLDVTKIAEAYGAKGLKIETDDDMPGVVAEALAHDGPVLIDVRTSLEYIAAYTTISDIRG